MNGARKKKDGFTYFGTQIKINDKVMMDYKLNVEINSATSLGLYVFLIYYKDHRYYIRACRDKGNLNPGFSLLLIRIDHGYVRIP
jgi:hypothetical protein